MDMFAPLFLLVYLVVPALVLLALYWVIRLAVRHALLDARPPQPYGVGPVPPDGPA